LHARRDRLFRAVVDVFNQLNAGFSVRQGDRDDAVGEVGSRVGGTSRASAADWQEGQIDIGVAEPAAGIWTKRIGATVPSLRAKRGLGKQQLHDVVDHAIAAKDLKLAVLRSPGSSQARLNLVAPGEVDGGDISNPDSRGRGQAFFLDTEAEVKS